MALLSRLHGSGVMSTPTTRADPRPHVGSWSSVALNREAAHFGPHVVRLRGEHLVVSPHGGNDGLFIDHIASVIVDGDAHEWFEFEVAWVSRKDARRDDRRGRDVLGEHRPLDFESTCV